MDKLFKSGCVVTFVTTSEDGKKFDSSGSGLLLNSDTIVTSASILLPIILQSRSLKQQIEHQGLKSEFPNIAVRVAVERIKRISTNENVITFKNYTTSLRDCDSRIYSGKEIAFMDADLIDIFTCDNFSVAFHDLFGRSNWSFDKNARQLENNTDKDEDKDDEDEDKANNNQVNKDDEEQTILFLMSKFLVIKIKNSMKNLKHEITTIFSDKSAKIGDRLEVCATAFGDLSPTVFMNSISEGVVSNTHGKDNCLILTDARCVPGSEGGPVYNQQKQVTGLVVISLCWKNNEWVGLSVICSMQEILSSLQNSQILNILPNAVHNKRDTNFCKSFYDRVVMVKVGATWGSGVIVHRDPTYVVTCNHVINNFQSSSVCIKTRRGGNSIKCRVLHHHHVPDQFDIALLTTSSHGHHVISKGYRSEVNVAAPVEGCKVFVVGHALFGDKYDLHPTVTSGLVSKVIKVNTVPVMIQTTCAVHPGASGGALINERGDLLGVVVSNTRDSTSGASFPHVSMCIPVITIWPIISQYCQKQDPSFLNMLNIKNKMVADIWSLGNQTKDSLLVSKL